MKIKKANRITEQESVLRCPDCGSKNLSLFKSHFVIFGGGRNDRVFPEVLIVLNCEEDWKKCGAEIEVFFNGDESPRKENPRVRLRTRSERFLPVKP